MDGIKKQPQTPVFPNLQAFTLYRTHFSPSLSMSPLLPLILHKTLVESRNQVIRKENTRESGDIMMKVVIQGYRDHFSINCIYTTILFGQVEIPIILDELLLQSTGLQSYYSFDFAENVQSLSILDMSPSFCWK